MSDLISRKELLKVLGSYTANTVLRRAGLPNWDKTTREVRAVFQAHGQVVKKIIEAAPNVEINGDNANYCPNCGAKMDVGSRRDAD